MPVLVGAPEIRSSPYQADCGFFQSSAEVLHCGFVKRLTFPRMLLARRLFGRRGVSLNRRLLHDAVGLERMLVRSVRLGLGRVAVQGGVQRQRLPRRLGDGNDAVGSLLPRRPAVLELRFALPHPGAAHVVHVAAVIRAQRPVSGLGAGFAFDFEFDGYPGRRREDQVLHVRRHRQLCAHLKQWIKSNTGVIFAANCIFKPNCSQVGFCSETPEKSERCLEKRRETSFHTGYDASSHTLKHSMHRTTCRTHERTKRSETLLRANGLGEFSSRYLQLVPGS